MFVVWLEFDRSQKWASSSSLGLGPISSTQIAYRVSIAHPVEIMAVHTLPARHDMHLDLNKYKNSSSIKLINTEQHLTPIINN